MAFGELDFDVVENEDVLQAVRFAHEANGAWIMVIHGPRVDPGVKEILTLAKEGVIELYQTDEYVAHHFVVITDRSGNKIVIDEGLHNETVWSVDGDVLHRSAVRTSYVHRNSRRLAAWMEAEFERRMQGARLSPTSLDQRPPWHRDERPLDSEILKQGLQNVPARMMQGVSILLDKPVGGAYKVRKYFNYNNIPSAYMRVENGNVATEEALFPRLAPVRVKVSAAAPEAMELDCPCGSGKLKWEKFAYSAGLVDRDLEVEEIYGYRCSSENCAIIKLLPETRKELALRILEALGPDQVSD